MCRPARSLTVEWVLHRDILKLLRRKNDDAASFEPHPPLLLPLAQLLVRALARHPDDLPDLFLRDRHLAPLGGGTRRLRQPQQCLGETARKVEEKDVLDLLAGVAQPRAKNVDELQRDFRLALDEGNEIPPVDQHQFAIRKRKRFGGSRTAIEQRDLPEDFARI